VIEQLADTEPSRQRASRLGQVAAGLSWRRWAAAGEQAIAVRIVYAGTLAYAALFVFAAVVHFEVFKTPYADLGHMVQAVWNTGHGHFLQFTAIRGHQWNRLGFHADPFLLVFVPFFWIWSNPLLLPLVQVLAVSSGALPVFWLARKHLGSERVALGFGLAYLLYPAVQWLTLNEFHPVALACPLLLYAFWYLDEDRLVAFGILAVLAALTKEEIPLVIAGMGLWYAFSRRRWLEGGAIALAGALVTAISVEVVLPHFNEGASSSFYQRYGSLGSSPGEILKTLLLHPGRVFETTFDHEGAHYLLDLFLPLLLLGLAAPLVLIAAVPELGLNLLSATHTQSSIHHHYTAGLIPPLFVAMILGAARLTRTRPSLRMPLAIAVVVSMVVANFVLGAVPVWRELPGGEGYQAYAAHVASHDRVTDRALRLIPDDAVVSATNSLGSHLSARRRFLSFPYIEDAQWVAADETQPGYADRWDPLATATDLAALRRNPDWRLVFSEDGVLVFKRRASKT
jgi:uncharacterized membrane protein